MTTIAKNNVVLSRPTVHHRYIFTCAAGDSPQILRLSFKHSPITGALQRHIFACAAAPNIDWIYFAAPARVPPQAHPPGDVIPE
jgi:hypothetical protein